MERHDFIEQIKTAFQVHPVVALIGPRQCGKTTLAKQYMQGIQDTVNYFDLENVQDLARLASPLLALGESNGLIIIDEIQRRPELFPTLRVLVDRQKKDVKFLILGSASRELLKQSSESLAGRIQYIELTPFHYPEVDNIDRLWLRGGFPNSYLANSSEHSMIWRTAYVKTFLEQDIPNLGITIPPQTLRRFWMMLTHYHGQIFNASEIGTSLGISHTTARRYLDILRDTFMIRELVPWFENIKKRQVKSPKIYFRDSGIYHALLTIPDKASLYNHPKLGASWEGYALEEITRHHSATPEECYFWGVHSQAELDLLIVKNGKRIGFEFKYTDAPKLTASMQAAIDTLKLDRLFIISPGEHNFPLTEKTQAMGLLPYCCKKKRGEL